MANKGTISATALLSLVLVLSCSNGCGRAGPQVSEEGQERYEAVLDHARARKQARENFYLLEKGIQAFQSRHGRLPAHLGELVQHGFIEEMPSVPEGLTYQYDPIYGNLRLVRVQERSR